MVVEWRSIWLKLADEAKIGEIVYFGSVFDEPIH